MAQVQMGIDVVAELNGSVEKPFGCVDLSQIEIINAQVVMSDFIGRIDLKNPIIDSYDIMNIVYSDGHLAEKKQGIDKRRINAQQFIQHLFGSFRQLAKIK